MSLLSPKSFSHAQAFFPTNLLRVNSATILFYLNALIFTDLFLQAQVLFCQCATMQWQHISPYSNMPDTLQQNKYFQHSSFPSEESADDRRTNIVVGMYKFHQIQGRNQLLAACVPGALPATSCPWWASCLAPHLVDKWAAGSSPASLGQKAFSMENSTFLNFSPVVKIPDCISMSDFQLRRNCRCLDVVTPSSMHTCSSVETRMNYHMQFTHSSSTYHVHRELTLTITPPNPNIWPALERKEKRKLMSWNLVCSLFLHVILPSSFTCHEG